MRVFQRSDSAHASCGRKRQESQSWRLSRHAWAGGSSPAFLLPARQARTKKSRSSLDCPAYARLFFYARKSGSPGRRTRTIGCAFKPRSGERVEHPECHAPFGPEFGGFAEYVEQGLASFLVEFLRDWQCFQHDHEARLGTGLVDEIGEAVVERVVVFAEMLGKQERRGD